MALLVLLRMLTDKWILFNREANSLPLQVCSCLLFSRHETISQTIGRSIAPT